MHHMPFERTLGSLGYLRFSRPVTVRSLFVHWVADRNAPRAIVAGRLGLQNMWNSSSVDVETLNNPRHTIALYCSWRFGRSPDDRKGPGLLLRALAG